MSILVISLEKTDGDPFQSAQVHAAANHQADAVIGIAKTENIHAIPSDEAVCEGRDVLSGETEGRAKLNRRDVGSASAMVTGVDGEAGISISKIGAADGESGRDIFLSGKTVIVVAGMQP